MKKIFYILIIYMNKIFIIGFNKTGTSSLHKALVMLGYPGIHGTMPNHIKVEKAIKENKKLLEYFNTNIIHFSDLDILKDNFKLLDEEYPNSKFILNTRDKKEWLISRKNHLQDYLYHINKGTNKYAKGWRWTEESVEQWETEWETHHKNVISYFKDKNNLLIIDVTKGEGFEKLCPF